jgi:hypothetical protein
VVEILNDAPGDEEGVVVVHGKVVRHSRRSVNIEEKRR